MGKGSIGNINTLFSLFHQGKKDINDAVQPWFASLCRRDQSAPAMIRSEDAMVPGEVKTYDR